MATRHKASSTRTPSKKGAAKRKAAPRKKAAAKKGAATARAAGPKRPAKRPRPTTETIARRIVRATVGDPSKIRFEDLYAETCTSREPAGPPAEGLEAIRQKAALWEAMIQGSTWRARTVFVRGSTIAIEWDVAVTMKDGRKVDFREVAIHEVKGGKIVAERYYYDPAQLAPPPERTEAPRPAAQAPPPGPPPVDPLDL